MLTVLFVSNSRHARWAGVCAALLVATNIALAAPLSGMSMNPARTLASAIPAAAWDGVWIYLIAPPAAMLAAAEVYLLARGKRGVFCAKLLHKDQKRCIFCEYHARQPHILNSDSPISAIDV